MIEPTMTAAIPIFFVVMAIVNLGAIFFIIIPKIWKLNKQREKDFFNRLLFFTPLYGIPLIRVSYRCVGYSFDGPLGWFCSIYQLVYSIAWLIPWIPIVGLAIFLYRRR